MKEFDITSMSDEALDLFIKKMGEEKDKRKAAKLKSAAADFKKAFYDYLEAGGDIYYNDFLAEEMTINETHIQLR